MIPPGAARWIRDVVLTPTYRKATSDPSKCPCQWGLCGHCQAGRHQQCTVIAWGGAPRASCDTYITNARGYVASARGIASTEVWRAGRPCRWVCPCGCTPVGPALPLAEQPAVEQLDLFAILPIGSMLTAGAAS